MLFHSNPLGIERSTKQFSVQNGDSRLSEPLPLNPITEVDKRQANYMRCIQVAYSLTCLGFRNHKKRGGDKTQQIIS